MLYPERESRHIEFKESPPTFISLIKTCVAFANGVGGKIIIGVEDQTRKIIGVNENTRKKVYEDFSKSLYDSTVPNLIAEIYEKNFGQHNVIVIEIFPVLKKPSYIKHEGIDNGVYLRAGTSTRKATQEYIEELKRENYRMTFDEEPIDASTNILSTELLKKVYPTYTNKKLLGDKILSQKTSNKKRYAPTVAGTLWFCQNPDTYIDAAHIRCSKFKGISGRDIIQTEEINGTLSDQIENSFSLIKSWLSRDLTLNNTKLIGKSLLPLDALREAIVNAIAHRKYTIPGAIKIALYENRLEVFSPGNFPGLVDINNLGDGTTYLRNPVIAKIARKLGHMEQLGTGISLILSSCKKMGLKSPEFIEGSDHVKVIFYFTQEMQKDKSDDENILKLFSINKSISISEVTELLQVSRNTATRRLNQLVRTGRLQRIGKGPAVRYIAPDNE